LTGSYHKARKSYGLFSALLVAWELIGIELTETPFESFKVKIKTPEVAPYVLVILVIYFAYRFTIEWLLINEENRKIRVALIDFYISHIIGLIAILIFIIQTAINIQIVKIIIEYFDLIAMFMLSFTLSLIIGSYVYLYKVRNKFFMANRKISIFIAGIFTIGDLYDLSLRFTYTKHNLIVNVIIFIIGIVTGLGGINSVRKKLS